MFNRKLATLALVLGTTAVIGACSSPESEPTDPAQGTDPAIENTDPTAPTGESTESPMDDSATDPTAVPEDETGAPANE